MVDPAEAEKALRLLMLKYPEQASLPLPMPTPADVRIFRVTPMMISVLDYSKGFGHAGRAIDDTEPRYKLPAGFHKSLELFNLHRAIGDSKTERRVVVG